jgi:uncharacterized protein (TIGR00369 family)
MPEPDGSNGRDAFAELLGIEYLELGGDEARARLPVTDDLRQPVGLVHGGVFSTLAEAVTSRATYEVVRREGMAAIGQSIETTFIRPITEGHVNAVARRRHGGRTTWIWDVEIGDDNGRLCALARMTIAVRASRESGS